MERWRSVPGYEGRYAVSDKGRVRSFLGRPTKSRQGLLAQTLNAGYLKVSLRKDGKTRTVGLHVLVAEAFLGPRPPRHDVAHNNSNPLDNRLTNLRYDTRAGNMKDKPPRQRSGIPSPVKEEIRSAAVQRGALLALAEKYGVSYATVKNYRRT